LFLFAKNGGFMKKIFLFLLVATSVLSFANQEKHPFNFYDMINFDRVSAPVLSPDGKNIAFTISDYSLEKNNKNTDIYLISVDGKDFKRLTNNEASDFNPIFSKDGKTIYFLSTRNGSSQIYKLSLNGGEPSQVTDFPVSVFNLKLSPNGKYFSFSANIYPESDFEKTAAIDMKKENDKCSAMVYETLFIRHWDTYEDGKWSHIFYYPVDGSKQPVDIMKGLEANCPSEPFGGSEEYSWSPDSSQIAFTGKTGNDRAWTTNYNIYLYDLKADKFENITVKNKAWDTAPIFSKDGNSLYYLAMKIPGYEADRFRIMKYNFKNKKVDNLTEKIQISPSSLHFSFDGKTIYFSAGKEAHSRIFAFNPNTKQLKELVSKHSNHSLAIGKDNIYFVQDSILKPAEIYKLNIKNNNVSQITKINNEALSKTIMGEPEEFWFTNSDNIKVHGWLIKPVNFDKNKKYPLAFYIHGGPQGSWTDHFHYRWNLEILPSQGYVVVAIDFRGSTGYGDAFREAIEKHWGDRPFNDLMEGLDYVLQKYSFIDGNRMGALGASYGGYMINWIAGNAPDRFKCLINHDGIFDETASYYNTEELWFPEYEHGGTPWEFPEEYRKFSPSTYVKNWKTPMLIIHGGKDYRVVETEGFSTFNALQRLGIPSKLIYFPDENHWVLKPANSEFWHKSVIDWMNKWVK
jgi:dipeptidyl aminopeptidase/acylaminoacyl peptidase